MVDSNSHTSDHHKYRIVRVHGGERTRSGFCRCPDVFRGSPPDGGWSWVVLFVSFLSLAISSGIYFNFGILFPDIVRYFNTNKGTASWAASVQMGFSHINGPLASALITMFGCRMVAVGGSALAAIALFVCTFSGSIGLFVFFYGVLGGIGGGIMNVCAVAIISVYFEQKRARAMGIALCGVGVGQFIMAPVIEFLIREYAWTGAMWICSAIMLNCAAFNCLLRPLGKASIHAKNTQETMYLHELKEAPPDPPLSGVHVECVGCYVTSSAADVTHQDMDEANNRNLHVRHKEPSSHPGVVIKCNDDNEIPSIDAPIASKKDIDMSSFNCDKRDPSVETDRQNVELDNANSACAKLKCKTDTRKPLTSRCAPFVRILAFFRSEMCNSKIIRNPAVLLYGASSFIISLAFFVPFAYLPTIAMNRGISKVDAAFLLSIVGISSTITRVIIGQVVDLCRVNIIVLYSLALVATGICTALVPLYQDYGLLAFYSIIVGVGTATVACAQPLICILLVGVDKMTDAFGFIFLCVGITTFVSSPIAGFIADHTGNLDVSFYFAGSMFCLGGLVSLPLLKMKRYS